MEREKCNELKSLEREIQRNFGRFYLAGGTAVMLRHSHRMGINLDFFSERAFSFAHVAAKMGRHFPIKKIEIFPDNVDLVMEGVKVSFVLFPFKNVNHLEHFQEINMASDYDIFLNKLYATERRIESMDDVDFAFLFKKYGWDRTKVKYVFERKFPSQSFEIYLGALLLIEDYPDLDHQTLDIIESIRNSWLE